MIKVEFDPETRVELHFENRSHVPVLLTRVGACRAPCGMIR